MGIKEYLLHTVEERSVTISELGAWEALIEELTVQEADQVRVFVVDEVARRKESRQDLDVYLKTFNEGTNHLIELLENLKRQNANLDDYVDALIESLMVPTEEVDEIQAPETPEQIATMLHQLSILQLETVKNAVKTGDIQDGISVEQKDDFVQLIYELQQEKQRYYLEHREEIEQEAKNVVDVLLLDELIGDYDSVPAS